MTTNYVLKALPPGNSQIYISDMFCIYIAVCKIFESSIYHKYSNKLPSPISPLCEGNKTNDAALDEESLENGYNTIQYNTVL